MALHKNIHTYMCVCIYIHAIFISCIIHYPQDTLIKPILYCSAVAASQDELYIMSSVYTYIYIHWYTHTCAKCHGRQVRTITKDFSLTLAHIDTYHVCVCLCFCAYVLYHVWHSHVLPRIDKKEYNDKRCLYFDTNCKYSPFFNNTGKS